MSAVHDFSKNLSIGPAMTDVSHGRPMAARADALGTHRWEIPLVKFIDLIWDLCYSKSYCPHTSAVSYQLITTQTLIQTQNTVRTVKDGLVAIPTEPFGSPHIVF